MMYHRPSIARSDYSTYIMGHGPHLLACPDGDVLSDPGSADDGPGVGDRKNAGLQPRSAGYRPPRGPGRPASPAGKPAEQPGISWVGLAGQAERPAEGVEPRDAAAPQCTGALHEVRSAE